MEERSKGVRYTRQVGRVWLWRFAKAVRSVEFAQGRFVVFVQQAARGGEDIVVIDPSTTASRLSFLFMSLHCQLSWPIRSLGLCGERTSLISNRNLGWHRSPSIISWFHHTSSVSKTNPSNYLALIYQILERLVEYRNNKSNSAIKK